MALNFTPHLYIPSINNIESTLYTSLWCVLCTLGNTITGRLLKMDFPGLPYSMKSLSVLSSIISFMVGQLLFPNKSCPTMDKNGQKHGKITE